METYLPLTGCKLIEQFNEESWQAHFLKSLVLSLDGNYNLVHYKYSGIHSLLLSIFQDPFHLLEINFDNNKSNESSQSQMSSFS